jgi:hypothetical protein
VSPMVSETSQRRIVLNTGIAGRPGESGREAYLNRPSSCKA